MSSSRREFLAGLASAGLLATVPNAAHAGLADPLLYPPMDLSAFDVPVPHGPSQIRVGCAAITWGNNAAQAVDDIAADGFAGIQLRYPALAEFPDPHALSDLLAQRKLAFVALSSGIVSLDPAICKSQLETHASRAAYVHEGGGSYLQLIAAESSPAATHTAAEYKLQAELFTEIGKRAADYGIKVAFHNHMNSVGQTPDAVDAILDASDPRYLFLLLDAAHYLQGGGDPATAIRKYGKRILFMHFKDVRNVERAPGYEWVELGEGRVDFPAVFAALKEINFRGWGIVELDAVPAGQALTSKEANAKSLRCLREKFGVQA